MKEALNHTQQENIQSTRSKDRMAEGVLVSEVKSTKSLKKATESPKKRPEQ